MKFARLDAGDVDYIVIHCAFTKPDMDIGVEEIRQWHRERGWLDVGYHYVVRRDGAVEMGRPVNAQGAHTYTYNDCSIGICLVGGASAELEDEDNFTDEQIASTQRLVDHLIDMFVAPAIVGHHHLDSTKTCPILDVRRVLPG